MWFNLLCQSSNSAACLSNRVFIVASGAGAACAVPRAPMPVPYVHAAGQRCVSSAGGRHGGMVRIPPLGVLAWVGGVAWCRARVGPLYIS